MRKKPISCWEKEKELSNWHYILYFKMKDFPFNISQLIFWLRESAWYSYESFLANYTVSRLEIIAQRQQAVFSTFFKRKRRHLKLSLNSAVTQRVKTTLSLSPSTSDEKSHLHVHTRTYTPTYPCKLHEHYRESTQRRNFLQRPISPI